MRDRTKANLISIAGMFIFFLLTPIIAHADQTTPSPTPSPSSLEIQRATVGIQGRVLSNNNYDVLIPIDTYYRVSFNTTGGTIINDQFIKKGSYAKEPTSPTRANYEFNYWTLTNTPTPENEHGQSEKFNFSTTPITSNITLVAVWTPSSPSDENKPNNDKEDNNSSGDNNNGEDNKDTSEDSENNGEDKEDKENKENSSDTKDNNTEDNEEDNKSSDNSNDNSESKDESNRNNGESTEDSDGLNDTSEESTETTEESSDGLINTHTNPSSNHSKTSTSSTPSIETDPDIATNTETTDLISEIKATVLGVFKTISKSITIVAKISLIGILIWFIWFIILLNNTLVKIQAPSEDQPDQSQPDQRNQSKSWKTVYLTPIKKTIEQSVGDKRTIWSLSLPQNLLDDNEELKVKIPWSVYHKAEDENQANQTELHITITSDQPDPTQPTMIYIITNETKEIKIK